jgi:predicted transcriptional regulator
MFTLNLLLILLVVFCLGAIVRILIQRKDRYKQTYQTQTMQAPQMQDMMQAFCDKQQLSLNPELQLGRGITRKEVKELPLGFTPILKSR